MTTDNVLNDKRLNFIERVMGKAASVLHRPVGEVGDEFSFDEFPGQLQCLCQGLDLGGVDWLGVEYLNLSVFLFAHFAVLDCPTGLIVLLRGDLQKGEDHFTLLIAFELGVGEEVDGFGCGLKLFQDFVHEPEHMAAVPEFEFELSEFVPNLAELGDLFLKAVDAR